MGRLEWWYDVENEFAAAAELLDETFSTRLLGLYDATVLLPSIRVGEDWYLAPPAQAHCTAEPSEAWGLIHTRKNHQAVGVVVKRLVLSVDTDQSGLDEKAAIHVVARMDTWWDSVRSWIEVVTGQHLTPVGHKGIETIGGGPIWYTSDDESGVVVIPAPATLDLSPRSVPAVTAEVMRGCLSLAADSDPQLPWLLVRDARSLHKAGQYRRAVIDAATAAELAITSMLDTRLNEVEAPVREALLASNRMLSRKKRLMKSLGCRPLPERLREDLEDPRNKAVHEGIYISGTESYAAISLAADVVEMAYPLPCPPGSHRPLRRLWT